MGTEGDDRTRSLELNHIKITFFVPSVSLSFFTESTGLQIIG
jgi:hypothetical protein